MPKSLLLCAPCAALLAACLGPLPAASAKAAPAKTSDDDSASESETQSSTKAFGIYQWDKDTTYGAGLQHEIGALGITPTYAMYFVDRDMDFPADIIRTNSSQNIKTILTQELVRYSHRDDYHVLDSILAGAWDGYFRHFARAARAVGEPIYYRFGYEMNGDWQVWGEQPEKFTKAWRRAWRIFREEKAANVRWVFSANVVWGDRTVDKDLLPYYPGNRYVDIVGLDGYNFGDSHSRFHTWKSFSEVFSTSLNALKRHYPAKPLWITEIGCAEGPEKARWIQDFFNRFNADPALRVFVWFNEDKQYAGEPNWRFDSDEDSLKKFRSWAIYNNSITLFSLPAREDMALSAIKSPGRGYPL